MKKNATMTLHFEGKEKTFSQQFGEVLAAMYSNLLEERVSTVQAWKILHASVAFCLVVFSWCSVFIHVLLLAWFLFTLWDCRRCGLK